MTKEGGVDALLEQLPEEIAGKNSMKDVPKIHTGRARDLRFRGPEDLPRIERSIDIRLTEKPRSQFRIVNINHPDHKGRRHF